MNQMGMLINYDYCTGCHSCEVACQMEHELPPDQFGIKITEVGPWEYAPDTWQYAYVPIPTDQCDLCAERLVRGKLPVCVQHCQAKVMQVGPLDQMQTLQARKPKQVVFALS